jgi:hypothetical protein
VGQVQVQELEEKVVPMVVYESSDFLTFTYGKGEKWE